MLTPREHRDATPPAKSLRVHPTNPRYFTDDTGKAILLTGSHTWLTLQDGGTTDPPPRFDYERWLDWLETKGHRFFRLWAWEQPRWVAHRPDDVYLDPMPYARTGPDLALDGKPKFDVTRFDDVYFARLRERVELAGRRGIYVAVMLFQGWSIQPKEWYPGLGLKVAQGCNPWLAHPFHRDNNVNGIDGDPRGLDHGVLTHTLALHEVWELRRAYIRRVIDAVADFGNVLYEIVNEDDATADNSTWQDAVVDFIHETEGARGLHHPVLRSMQWPGTDSHDPIFASPAEAIAPNSPAQHGFGFEDYRNDPPCGDGRKVIVLDTDHLWGIGGTTSWVWRAVMRGLNPILMDPWEGDFVVHGPFEHGARDAMGVARYLCDRLDFGRFSPRTDVATTRFALVEDGGARIVAYEPIGEMFTVNLGTPHADYRVEWVHPTSGLSQIGTLARGGLTLLQPPFPVGGIAILTRRDTTTNGELA